jgi:hypothetical protein
MTEKNSSPAPKTTELEKLLQLQRRMDARVTAARLNIQRREARAAQKEQSLIGAAVVKASAALPDFKTMLCQTALAYIIDEKERRFLSDRGWRF